MTDPEIKILAPGDEALLEPFLLGRLESSMFLVSNLRTAGLVDDGCAFSGAYAAAFENGAVTGVAAHYWNNQLVLQAPAHLETLWRAALRASSRPVGGVVGPAEQVALFRVDSALPTDLVLADELEKLYRLELDELRVPLALREGWVRARRAVRRDLDLLTRWRVGYMMEITGVAESPVLWQNCRAGVERSQRAGHTWVLEQDGEAVGCSSFNAEIAEAVQVGGVWTPPEQRGRGYARAVVAATLLEAGAAGVSQAFLFTGEANLPAQKAYLALGFREVGAYCLLWLRLPWQPAFD